MPPAAGRRAAPEPERRQVGRPLHVLLHLGGLAALVAAWVAMVAGAVVAGRQTREGEVGGWLLLVMGTVGAVACLLLALLVAGRLLRLLRIIDDYQPRRARRR